MTHNQQQQQPTQQLLDQEVQETLVSMGVHGLDRGHGHEVKKPLPAEAREMLDPYGVKE